MALAVFLQCFVCDIQAGVCHVEDTCSCAFCTLFDRQLCVQCLAFVLVSIIAIPCGTMHGHRRSGLHQPFGYADAASLAQVAVFSKAIRCVRVVVMAQHKCVV
jgi:hypothetical protein